MQWGQPSTIEHAFVIPEYGDPWGLLASHMGQTIQLQVQYENLSQNKMK